MRIILCFVLLMFSSIATLAQSENQSNQPLATGTLQPRLGVSPPRVELTLNESGQANGEFSIINTSNAPLEIELTIFNWDLDENNNTRLIEPTEQSLDQWLIINPLRFTVSPQSNQTVRFGVRPRVKPEIGEHRAIVYVREVPNSNDDNVNMRITYGLPIYANYGEIERRAIIHTSKLNKKDALIVLDIDLSNPGKFYTRPQGMIGIWKKSEYPGDAAARDLLADNDGQIESALISQPALSKPILPGYRRHHITRIGIDDLPKGQYIARAYVKIGDNIVQEKLTFSQ